jgi:hypothetical protein
MANVGVVVLLNSVGCSVWSNCSRFVCQVDQGFAQRRERLNHGLN